MILLQGNNIARLFGADVLFEHIQIEIQDRSRIALVGRNGAGKSTLLKILAGIEEADQGTLTTKKNLKLGYLSQDTGLLSTETVWDEILSVFEPVLILEKEIRKQEQLISTLSPQDSEYETTLASYASMQHQFEELNGYGYESEIRSILHGFQFGPAFYEKPISTLSGGQKTRLSLVKLLLEKPELLILDEPTNHLDIQTLSWLENYLQNYQGSLLIVSHDRYFLDKITTEVYELSRMKMQHYRGNYSKYLELKEAQLSQEWKLYEKQQVEIAKLEEFIQKNIARATTTKRAQSRRKTLEKLDRMDRPQGDEKSAHFLFPIKEKSGNHVLQIQDAAIGYETTILSEPINLELKRQEAIALIGPNGIGKSTLLKSVIAKIPFIKGRATFGTNVEVGYYDQEQADLHSKKTVLAELWDEHASTPEKDIRSILGSFLFSGEDVKKSVPMLSGGEKARLALAKLAMNQENFLILDEPTNHLDIDSKEVLENALISYEGTLLFVSHDRYFINRIATKILELSETGSKLYLGDYDYYLEKKKEEEEIAEALALQSEKKLQTVPQSTTKERFKKDKEQQRLERNIQRKITQCEEDLLAIETDWAQLQETMLTPEIITDHQKLGALNEELKQLEERQEYLLEQWEEFSLELEDIQKQG